MHGLEAAAGAATILQWLDEKQQDALPPDVSVLLIHALNPFGWAHSSRCNEDGVDLNRNSIDWTAPPPENQAYDDIHEFVARADIDEKGLQSFTSEIHGLIQRKGLAYALHAAAAGQYVYSSGLSYGGSSLSWSCRIMFEIAETYLKRTENVLFLDWHTGIGPYAEPFFIIDSPKTSRDYILASSWWPTNRIHSEDALDEATPNYTGLLTVGVREVLLKYTKISLVGMVVEWGTYDISTMLQALLMDNWLRKNSHLAGTEKYDHVRSQIIERFCPAAPAWRRAVLEKSRGIYEEALAGIDRWNS